MSQAFIRSSTGSTSPNKDDFPAKQVFAFQPNMAAAMGMLAGGLGRSKYSSLELQTSLAFQELGIVIGVAILVTFLFFILIYTEKLGTCLIDKIQAKKPPDEENPAALVGTYKSNKN